MKIRENAANKGALKITFFLKIAAKSSKKRLKLV